MKKIKMAIAGVSTSVISLLISASAFAQAAADTTVQTQAKTQFNDMATFFIDVLSGPLAKVFALVFLIAGIWNIVNKEYGAAFGCVIALLCLIFMPQLLSMFNR